MNKLVTLFVFLFLSIVSSWAEKDSVVTDVKNEIPFSHIYVSIEGGEKYPFGDLIDAVENSFYGGLGFRYTYWEDFDGILLFQYAYFKPHEQNKKIFGVHEFSGKVGLDYKLKLISPIAIGGGFLCNWTRADYDIDKKEFNYSTDLGASLADNETEFGWYARLNLPILNLEKYRAGLNVLWEELWTLPKRSNILSVGLYIERRIW